MKNIGKNEIFLGPKKNLSILSKFAVSVPLLVGLIVFTSGCVIPPFSDIQSAKLVGPGHFEVTPHYSSVSSFFDGESEKEQDHFGLQMGFGVSSFMDFRARYEYISINEESVNVFGFGPKFSLVKDWVAIYVPIGFAFGEDIDTAETWQVHPTLLLSLPVSPYFELNPSVKALIYFQQDSETLLAFNLGAGISSNLEQWAIRPEIGFLIDPGEEGCYFHISIGFSLNTKFLKK